MKPQYNITEKKALAMMDDLEKKGYRPVMENDPRSFCQFRIIISYPNNRLPVKED